MKVAVLVSGGVDSSVALRLLQEQGHEVTAFYLKIWLEDETSYLGSCPWEDDLSYVRQVCDQSGVPLFIVPLQKEYHDEVVSYVLREVQAGRTPNPDMLCNKHIKFGLFLKHIDQVFPGMFDKIASGHYAQVREHNGTYYLVQSPDVIKDQTYFLAALNQQQLSRLLFPIGHLTKQEVRAKAQEFDLANKDRKDSQGICFLGKLKFEEFLRHYLGDRMGELIDYESGNVVGQHKGFWYYTIGQRHGIGLSGGPWYVVSKDATANQVFVSRTYYAEDKQRVAFQVRDCTWLTHTLDLSRPLRVKLRHGPLSYACNVARQEGDESKLQVRLLDGNDQGIAAGQFAVFYDRDVCLGSGVIV